MNIMIRFFATFFVAIFLMLAVWLAFPPTVYSPMHEEYTGVSQFISVGTSEINISIVSKNPLPRQGI